ncbi:MAG: hypothetical protein JO111_13250 [Caulobacteraceae bacterium]|nr:hypothetical protein [Caulobacteraceae bacterium]
MERRLVEALRHVRDGEIHVRRQRRIVEALREDGHNTATALEILGAFEWSLTLHRSHLAQVLANRHTALVRSG